MFLHLLVLCGPVCPTVYVIMCEAARILYFYFYLRRHVCASPPRNHMILRQILSTLRRPRRGRRRYACARPRWASQMSAPPPWPPLVWCEVCGSATVQQRDGQPWPLSHSAWFWRACLRAASVDGHACSRAQWSHLYALPLLHEPPLSIPGEMRTSCHAASAPAASPALRESSQSSRQSWPPPGRTLRLLGYSVLPPCPSRIG